MIKQTYLLTIALVLSLTNALNAQNDVLEQVKKEVEAITLKEQHAFKTGDCDTVMALMDDAIVFYANGRPAPPKKAIENFCKNIKRPFQKLKKQQLTIYPLSPSSAYVVRILEFNKKESIPVRETVTKIWNKKNGEWKMVHLHSTVKEQVVKQ